MKERRWIGLWTIPEVGDDEGQRLRKCTEGSYAETRLGGAGSGGKVRQKKNPHRQRLSSPGFHARGGASELFLEGAGGAPRIDPSLTPAPGSPRAVPEDEAPR